MNKAHARKAAPADKPKAKQSSFTLDAARIAYVASSARIDLLKLSKVFENAPDDVEVCGEPPKAA